MLEAVWKHGVLFYAVGVMCVLGVISKITVSLTLRRLVKEAGKMGKSLHPLMKLVRAKFEHACMVSDKVQNIRAFVDKYMYEYKVLWIKLHSWRQMEKAAAWCCLVFGAAGAAAAYVGEAPLETVGQYAAAGLAGSLLLFALRMVTDEGYQLEAAKNYMIEFLENTYARRYEKMSQTAEVEEEIQLVEKKAVLEEGPTENEKETIAAFQAEAESQEMEEEAAPAVAAAVPPPAAPSRPTPSRTRTAPSPRPRPSLTARWWRLPPARMAAPPKRRRRRTAAPSPNPRTPPVPPVR